LTREEVRPAGAAWAVSISPDLLDGLM
jgi:hypothetical protein